MPTPRRSTPPRNSRSRRSTTPRRSSERSRTITISSSRQTRDAKRGGRGANAREAKPRENKKRKEKAPPRSRSSRSDRSSSRNQRRPLRLPSFRLVGFFVKLGIVALLGFAVVYGVDAAWRFVTGSEQLAELGDKLIKRLLDDDVPRVAEPKDDDVTDAKKTVPSKAAPAPKDAPATGGDAKVPAKGTRAELPAESPEDYARATGGAVDGLGTDPSLDDIVGKVVDGQ